MLKRDFTLNATNSLSPISTFRKYAKKLLPNNK